MMMNKKGYVGQPADIAVYTLTSSLHDEVAVNDETPTFTSKRHEVSSRKQARTSRNKRSRNVQTAAKNRGGSQVTIKRGQTLSEIARRNGTTVAKLKKLNGIKGNNIQAGKKLKVK